MYTFSYFGLEFLIETSIVCFISLLLFVFTYWLELSLTFFYSSFVFYRLKAFESNLTNFYVFFYDTLLQESDYNCFDSKGLYYFD